jgi:hypothetical protein
MKASKDAVYAIYKRTFLFSSSISSNDIIHANSVGGTLGRMAIDVTAFGFGCFLVDYFSDYQNIVDKLIKSYMRDLKGFGCSREEVKVYEKAMKSGYVNAAYVATELTNQGKDTVQIFATIIGNFLNLIECMNTQEHFSIIEKEAIKLIEASELRAM